MELEKEYRKDRAKSRKRTRIITLGKVHTVVGTGHIVVSIEERKIALRRLIGTRAYKSENKSELGFVVDVIGNIEKPYAIIKPYSRDSLDSIRPGDQVYIVIKERPRGHSKSSKKIHRRG